MADKIFCGSGKEFGQYGQISLDICLTDLPTEHIRDYNGKKYIKMKLSRKKEKDKRGNTHYVEVDTWKPQNQNTGWGGSQLPEDNGLPF